MKIAKIAAVSTIALGIAMSTAALAQTPNPLAEVNSPARQKAINTPRIPAQGKRACASNLLALPAGVSTDVGLGITFFIGVPRAVALLFSAEQATSGGLMLLDYSVDGAAPIPIGPQIYSSDTSGATRTAYGVHNAPFTPGPLSPGTHTITPFLTSTGAGAVQFRCFSVSP
jgi:hypothetical protein